MRNSFLFGTFVALFFSLNCGADDFRSLGDQDQVELVQLATRSVQNCLAEKKIEEVELGSVLNKTSEHVDKNRLVERLTESLSRNHVTLRGSTSVGDSKNIVSLNLSSSSRSSETGFRGTYQLSIVIYTLNGAEIAVACQGNPALTKESSLGVSNQ